MGESLGCVTSSICAELCWLQQATHHFSLFSEAPKDAKYTHFVSLPSEVTQKPVPQKAPQKIHNMASLLASP